MFNSQSNVACWLLLRLLEIAFHIDAVLQFPRIFSSRILQIGRVIQQLVMFYATTDGAIHPRYILYTYLSHTGLYVLSRVANIIAADNNFTELHRRHGCQDFNEIRIRTTIPI